MGAEMLSLLFESLSDHIFRILPEPFWSIYLIFVDKIIKPIRIEDTVPVERTEINHNSPVFNNSKAKMKVTRGATAIELEFEGYQAIDSAERIALKSFESDNSNYMKNDNQPHELLDPRNPPFSH
jgi:hypothetical protein